MKREEMNKIIKFELEHIPKGNKGSTQNKLRFYYNTYRRRDMVKGLQREKSIKEAIDMLKKDHPNFNPEFDSNFFRIQKSNLLQRLLGWIKKSF